MPAFRILFMVFTMLACFAANADKPIAINIVTDEWNDYSDRDGNGYYLELLRAVYNPHGIKLKIQYVPYARTLAKMRSGDADVILGIYKGEFEDRRYSKHPVHIDITDAVISNELNKTWLGEKSLKGKRVAGYIGYSFDKILGFEADYMEIRSLDSMVKMLVAGRVDAVLDYKSDLIPKLKELGVSDRFVIKNALYKIPNYFVFGDSIKGNEYRAIFDSGMAALIKSGKIKELIMKNLGDEEYYPDYQQFE